MRLRSGVVLTAALTGGVLSGQVEFRIAERPVQVHGFVSQGFAWSNQNNYLTMDTSRGSFAMTDGGLNVSSQLTDHLRVGAQAYVRSIGQLGKGHVTLDWAVADYRFNGLFGVRVGKVKTVMGAYNDTQDAESLHTWALLPQSLYPLDLRSTNIAHVGGDVYGTLPLGKMGSAAYTGYFGFVPDDKTSGWYYSNADIGYPIRRIKSRTWGADVRWNTPVTGLMVGASAAILREHWDGWLPGRDNGPYIYVTPNKWMRVGYIDYQPGKWHFTAEYMHTTNDGLSWDAGPPWYVYPYGYMGWYVSASYRLNRRLEFGTYDSQYEFLWIPSTDHSFDRAATVRFDLGHFWSLKAEEHFINGNGGAMEGAAHGFYMFDNPDLHHSSALFVVRLGFSF